MKLIHLKMLLCSVSWFNLSTRFLLLHRKEGRWESLHNSHWKVAISVFCHGFSGDEPLNRIDIYIVWSATSFVSCTSSHTSAYYTLTHQLPPWQWGRGTIRKRLFSHDRVDFPSVGYHSQKNTLIAAISIFFSLWNTTLTSFFSSFSLRRVESSSVVILAISEERGRGKYYAIYVTVL